MKSKPLLILTHEIHKIPRVMPVPEAHGLGPHSPYSVILKAECIKVSHEAPSLVHSLGYVLEDIPQIFMLGSLVHSINHA